MKKNKIYLSPPHLGEMEQHLVEEAIASNWISSVGPQLDSFENEICEYTNIPYAVALSSGTAALHLALKLSGVKQGDFVLCPSLTFAASANAILYEKAIPVFIDSYVDTWSVNINLIERAINKYNPKAIISVDLYGQSADYDVLVEICKKNNIKLIEDAAEALGAEYKQKKCGSFGDMGIFSFNGNKIITTSGGGMLVSKNEDLVDKARFFSTQSREPVLHYEHKELGYNYRMSNILAAIGRGQLTVLDDRVTSRRKIFDRYFNSLSAIDGISFMSEASYGLCNRWLTTLTIDSDIAGIDRKQIIHFLDKENIESRPVWKPMHMQPLYKKCDYLFENKDISRNLFENGLCLPSGSDLSEVDQNRIISIIKDIL